MLLELSNETEEAEIEPKEAEAEPKDVDEAEEAKKSFTSAQALRLKKNNRLIAIIKKLTTNFCSLDMYDVLNG